MFLPISMHCWSLFMSAFINLTLVNHLNFFAFSVGEYSTDFNFETQGIQSYIDGDWVTAKGTTLGADNGMGVASIMTLLASEDIEHPTLEALFTIDENSYRRIRS